MPAERDAFLKDHEEATRRFFLKCGSAGVAAFAIWPSLAEAGDERLAHAISKLETWLTKPGDFPDVSRGQPKPHALPAAKRKEVGLTRETWKLQVIPDPKNPARVHSPLSDEKKTAFDFASLMDLARKHKVRFPKVMTCLNIGCPLGNGIWEGVPLREVLWKAQPSKDLRRVFYHGYHNDDPKQMFRSSLPVGRILEDPFDLPPVILCYKLNDQWLTPERGGPVRVVFPEGYGFKSIKWLSHVYLSNIATANDTYAKANNDVDSDLKTFCETLFVPKQVKVGEPIPVTGYAQVGISGLKKVQTWIHDEAKPLPQGGKYFSAAPWKDARILPAPQKWGGGLPGGRLPVPITGFDSKTRRPKTWPIRLSKAHWAALLPGLPAGEYTLRCRTIDEKGIAQPMPRPFRKSGRAHIAKVKIVVK